MESAGYLEKFGGLPETPGHGFDFCPMAPLAFGQFQPYRKQVIPTFVPG
jgi:hypothetical protein